MSPQILLVKYSKKSEKLFLELLQHSNSIENDVALETLKQIGPIEPSSEGVTSLPLKGPLILMMPTSVKYISEEISIPGDTVETIENFAIRKTVEHFDGSTIRAARVLGISQRKIQAKLKQWRKEEAELERKKSNLEEFQTLCPYCHSICCCETSQSVDGNLEQCAPYTCDSCGAREIGLENPTGLEGIERKTGWYRGPIQ